MIQGYVSLLVQRLRDNCGDWGQTPQDMTSWYHWTTFDILGDLAFGEPFDCLEKARYNPWVSLIFEVLMTANKITTLLRFGYVGKLLLALLIPRSHTMKMIRHKEQSAIKVEKRLKLERERGDLIGKMLSGSKKQGSVSLFRYKVTYYFDKRTSPIV